MNGKKLAPLQIEEVPLNAGDEWNGDCDCWRVARLHSGVAYWVGAPRGREELAPDDSLIIGPKAKGVIRASQIGFSALHVFCFAPDQLWGLLTVTERRFFETGDLAQVRVVRARQSMAQQFKALTEEFPGLNPFSRRLRALELIANAFGEQMSRQLPPEPKGNSGRDRFRLMISRLTDNELAHHHPERLAELCGCTPHHFNRLFRREFGQSIRDRQAELRMSKAKTLLATSNEKLNEIAHACGYPNLTLFTIAFKRRAGFSPSAWRRKAIREAIAG